MANALAWISGGAAAAFTPITPTSSLSWWHGDDFIPGADNPIWADRGVGNYTLTATAGTHIETGILDSLKYVIFIQSGANRMFNSSYTCSQPHTVVFLLNKDPTGNGENPNLAKFTNQLISGYASPLAWIYENAGSTVSSAATDLPSTWAVIEAVFNGASSEIRFNKTIVASGDAGSGTASGIQIGADGDFNNRLKANILDIATYSGVLSTSDRNDLYSYFQSTYPSAGLP